MRRNVIISLLLLLFSFSACDSIKTLFKGSTATQNPFTIHRPDSLGFPETPPNEWVVQRTGVNEYTYFPPKPAPRKIKNSFNTDNSQKKSNNTEIDNKKSGNTDSFNNNKKQGQMQDVGNVNNKKQGQVKQPGYTWVAVVLILLVLLYQFWPDIRTWIRRILSAAYGLL